MFRTDQGGRVSIDVLLAGGLPLERLALRLVLEKEPEFTIVGEAIDGAEALAMCLAIRPDVIILDINLPGYAAGEFIQKLNDTMPVVKIILLDVNPKGIGGSYLGDGKISGIILKTETERDLIDAVRTVMGGQLWFRQSGQEPVVVEEKPGNTLTQREQEVLRLVALGRTNAQIGTELNIDERTVRQHMENIIQKMQVANRTEAVSVAVKHGWI